jgi:tetratricopeptide (TPR) repeat protein
MTAPHRREIALDVSTSHGADLLAPEMAAATRHHEQGALADAERIYCAVLAAQPLHFEALHRLGVLRHQQGRSAEALELIATAIECNAASADALANFGVVFDALGHPEEAVAAYDQALALAPDQPDTLSNRAGALNRMGRAEAALASCDAALALDPRQVDALCHRGNARFALHRYAEAVADYDAALVLRPAFVEACCNRAEALARLGLHEQALVAFEQALVLAPDHVEALVGRAGALIDTGKPAEAMRSLKQALALAPDHALALARRGRALFLLEQPEQALASLDASLALAPAQPTALNHRGDVLLALTRFKEALASYQAAFTLSPGYFQVLNNIGNALAALDRVDEAERAFDAALTLAPGYAIAECNKGTLYRSCGRLAEGWELFERRWAAAKSHLPRPYPQPRWSGGKVERELVVWGEQGLGDQILYASMVPDLAERAGSLVLEVEPRLVALFARSFPQARVVALGPDLYAGDIDAQVPMGSLGLHLRRGFDAFPGRENYLVADPARTAALRARLKPDGKAVIGLSWRSGAPILGRAKTAQLAEFEALLRLPGCRFVDLQYGDTSGERAAIERAFGVRIERLEDIDNTNDIDALAALVSACDAVATVSNTTAHLAGALGRPTWLFVPFGNAQHWYWFRDRDDSPWYPQARMRRQRQAQPWADLVGSAVGEISSYIAKA